MRRDSLWGSSVFRLVLGVFYGCLWTAAGMLLLSVALLFMQIPERMLMLAADCFWGLGAFMAGSRAGFHARRHGIRTGLLCGALLCGVLLSGGVHAGMVLSSRIGIRCGILLLAGICGGVRGVNRKITKPPY